MDDLQLLKQHLASFESKSAAKCVVCGEITCFKCWECGGIPCCFKDGASLNTISCCIDLHDDSFFGLLMHNQKNYYKKANSEYKPPKAEEVKKILLTLENSANNIMQTIWMGMGINLGCIFYLVMLVSYYSTII